MKYPEILLWLPPLAVLLDLLLGDPRNWPHPVRLIGRVLKWQEERVLGAKGQRLAGAAGLGIALALTGLAVLALISLPWGLGLLFSLYFAYAGLALGCLLREGKRAALAVRDGSLEEARSAVSLLVSRDVSAMGQGELYKTLAETLSENFNDGFVAPFFWFSLAGPVGLWLYKAASTADSMWGYRHEPWGRAGFAAARLDDLMAYIPARISMLFLYLGGTNKELWPGRKEVARQARLMESPNAGWSMAAAAWLHGAPMGGPAVYAGKLKEKPRLGPESGAWDFAKISALGRHLLLSGLLSALALWGVSLILGYLYAYYQ